MFAGAVCASLLAWPGSATLAATTTALYHDSAHVCNVRLQGHDCEAAPRVVWATQAGGDGDDASTSVLLDTEGDLYVTGQCGFAPRAKAMPATFGTTTLPCEKGRDMFLAKVGSRGEALWATDQPPTQRAASHRRAVDNFRSVYETGQYDTGDMFVTKHTALSEVEWSKVWSGTGRVAGNSIVVGDSFGANHGVFLTGHFSGTVLFDGVELSSQGPEENSAAFVLKLNDTTGHVLWGTQLTARQGTVLGYSIAVNVSDAVYVTGGFEGTLNISAGADADDALRSAGSHDVFVMKLSADGEFRWVMRVGGLGHDMGNAVVLDAGGGIYVAGAFSKNAAFGDFKLESAGHSDAFWMKVIDAS